MKSLQSIAIKAITLCIFMLACAGSVTAQQAEGTLRMPLSVGEGGPWYRLRLPFELIGASRFQDLRDLRLYNAEDGQMPYSIVSSQSRTDLQLSTRQARLFPLYAQPGQETPQPEVEIRYGANGALLELRAKGGLSQRPANAIRRGWLVDAGAFEQPLTRLVLDLPDGIQGFQRFTIEASEDLQHWRSLGEGKVVRLSFQGEQIERREIALSPTRSPYLRLLWRDPLQAPELKGLQLVTSATTRTPPPLLWSPAIQPARSQDHEYVWQLPHSLALKRIRLQLDEANLLLPATLWGRVSAKQGWRRLRRGLFYRISRQGELLLQDELELPAGPVIGELKLEVDDRIGAMPKRPPSLMFGIEEKQLVFLAQGPAPYTLTVEAQATRPVTLPLSTLMPGSVSADLERLPQAEPGPLQWQRAAPPAPPEPPVIDWKRYLLWATLLGGVGALILMAWSLLRSRPASE